ncbi:cyclic nucleotide-binding domain-containing protein [Anianabacter salinae]|uniref:cyclic nucleotide-binding domain-containing protein n=1 Tax=Anianabacter salinae TaxID=2851023 RepID=UPI00225E0FFF|nr:cyclic nucleotide-binding domain-containing protein [Anianabacter salinae]MBV0912196.1 cyclic nucleotide-binding domain-containing protein [Anianabacter salinae]
MSDMIKQMRRFFRFEGVSLEVVVVTALISYVLQINAIVGGEPLYMIAFFTLLPWIPLALFEGVWKVKNYSFIAVLGLFTVLQIGHFGEHVIQVVQLNMLNGTVACPPPVDTIDNAARAIQLGLREATMDPTYYSVDRIAKAGQDGMPLLDENGDYLVGPAACAIFGQLDLEVVHLAWELVGYFGTGLVLLAFPRNKWLFIALLALSWHALEHLTITYFYYFDQEPLWPGFQQLWATVPVSGNIFMAVPAGQVETMLNFYQAGGKFGLMANNGLFEQLTGYDGMPGRPELHMGYNLAITIPTVIGFLVELRKLRSRYLEQSFSELSVEQITSLSQRVDDVSFGKGDVILREGDPASHCFLIKEGLVAIYVDHGGPNEKKVAELRDGSLLGEMGLIDGKPRSATAIAMGRVGCLKIDAVTFRDLIDPTQGEFRSEATMRQVMRIADMRRADG